MVRIFPFMLVMWSLAGALYPAVDLCAGEKERGTMETLLITPARREEIVLGKFSHHLDLQRPVGSVESLQHGHHDLGIRLAAHARGPARGCAALVRAAVAADVGLVQRHQPGDRGLCPQLQGGAILPDAAVPGHDAADLSDARAGVELNPFYSLIPVTGVALLMQRLMTATSLAQVPWLYFVPVFAPMALYSWLTLKWAIVQFQREEVLFREAERIDLRLWLRSLFREKEAMPTTGQAFFCFGLLFCLRWLATGPRQRWDAVVQAAGHHAGVHADARAIHGGLAQHQAGPGIVAAAADRQRNGPGVLLAVLLDAGPGRGHVRSFQIFPPSGATLEEGQPLFQVLRFLYENTELAMALSRCCWRFRCCRPYARKSPFAASFSRASRAVFARARPWCCAVSCSPCGT